MYTIGNSRRRYLYVNLYVYIKEEGHSSTMKPDLHIYLSIKLSSLKQFVYMRLFLAMNGEKNENKLIRSIPFTHPHTSRYDVHLHSFLFFMRRTIFFLETPAQIPNRGTATVHIPYWLFSNQNISCNCWKTSFVDALCSSWYLI